MAELADCNNADVGKNTLLMRNYNDGKHGGWDNYCCYKGNNKGTFVNKNKTTEAVTEKTKQE